MRSMIPSVLFFAVVAMVRAKSFVRFANVNTEEANRYVSALAASLRTDPIMGKFDPLILPAEKRFGVSGHYELDNATATGLSTIDRHGDSHLIFDELDQTGRINATLRTNDIRVSAHLKVSTNSNKNSPGTITEGQVYGSIKKMVFTMAIKIRQNFTAALIEFKRITPIYIEPLPGFSDPVKEEVLRLVEEAIEETFEMKYGPYIQSMVDAKLNITKKVERFIKDTKFPLLY